MQPVEIKKDIFWVGCVDYDHRDFHGYSRSPEGSTYNAYLIRDEKNVLMDTVYPGWAGNMLCRIAKIMDPEKIDYIVCNHMEPDHAGSLAEVVARVKPEKIFVSTLGYKSMQGYFDCKDWPIEVVKSGDKLNIGKRNIIFQETRMLHWPDSMVSYIPEDKLLISNDAFGQNIATSYRYADEHDQGDFVRAIKEYYYNIVLPYSPQVLKTLPIVESNHHSEIMTELANCGAVIAGSPTHNNTIMPLMASTLTYMKGLRPQNRVGGAFGSFGWSGESAKVLHEMLASMGMDMPADFVKCTWTPRHEALRACVELGKTVGEALKKKCQGE